MEMIGIQNEHLISQILLYTLTINWGFDHNLIRKTVEKTRAVSQSFFFLQNSVHVLIFFLHLILVLLDLL